MSSAQVPYTTSGDAIQGKLYGTVKGGCFTRKNRQGGGGVTVGSKRQVFNGTAKHTPGGLKKKDLMKYKGKIVSRKKHTAGLKAIKILRKKGYVAKKGTFKLFKKH